MEGYGELDPGVSIWPRLLSRHGFRPSGSIQSHQAISWINMPTTLNIPAANLDSVVTVSSSAYINWVRS